MRQHLAELMHRLNLACFGKVHSPPGRIRVPGEVGFPYLGRILTLEPMVICSSTTQRLDLKTSELRSKVCSDSW